MKPAWDSLAEHYKGSSSVGIYDVDCTTDAGKPVCNKVGVRGYPTIKYFLPFDETPLDYKGGRSLDDLKRFAETTFVAACDVATQEGCSDSDKALLDKYKALGAAGAKAEIVKLQAALAAKTKERQDKESECSSTIARLKGEEKAQGQVVGFSNTYLANVDGGKDEL